MKVYIEVEFTGAPWDMPTPQEAQDRITRAIETNTKFEVRKVRVTEPKKY